MGKFIGLPIQDWFVPEDWGFTKPSISIAARWPKSILFGLGLGLAA